MLLNSSAIWRGGHVVCNAPFRDLELIEEGSTMLNPGNQVDKDRFEKLKHAQTERGRNDEKATEVAAEEVKEMRRREGRERIHRTNSQA